MNTAQPDFQSLKNIRDNALLLTIANEYICENVYLSKIGADIKKNLSGLKDDILALKKKFPGKFTQEVNTDNILTGFQAISEEMISGGDEILNKCSSGKLGMSLNSDMERITEAIDKIWRQVKGSDIQYTAADSISGFLGKLNIFPVIVSMLSRFIKILLVIFVVLLAGFSYLYFTMEKEGTILRENSKIMAYLEEKQDILDELEKKKAEAQKNLEAHKSSELLRKDKIAIIDFETKIQELNQEIHLVEGHIATGRQDMDMNNEKLEKMKSKSFLDRLLRH